MTRPMLGFKDFRFARVLLGGIELMHMIAKGQMRRPGGATASAASNSIPSLHKPSSTAGVLPTDLSYCDKTLDTVE